jgi:hypothetical protein
MRSFGDAAPRKPAGNTTGAASAAPPASARERKARRVGGQSLAIDLLDLVWLIRGPRSEETFHKRRAAR